MFARRKKDWNNNVRKNTKENSVQLIYAKSCARKSSGTIHKTRKKENIMTILRITGIFHMDQMAVTNDKVTLVNAVMKRCASDLKNRNITSFAY